MVNFKADNVKPSEEACSSTDAKDFMESLVNTPAKLAWDKEKREAYELPTVRTTIFEATSNAEQRVIKTQPIHGFVAGALEAYKKHYPFVISPDAFWITLTQGLANHINLNAEALRNKFVSHEGQVELIAERHEFIKGSPDNDWAGVFTEFSDKIKNHIGEKTHSSIVANFSTTGLVERAASEVVLMDSMQSYFKYSVHTLCGIPEFTIEGTKDDWCLMKERISAWSELGLANWVMALNTILDQIIDTFDGKVNKDFWTTFFKESGGSGGPYVNGWINWLFPYVKGYKDNSVENKLIGKMGGNFSGMTTECYPSALCKTPFDWVFPWVVHKYNFIAGISGVTQLDNLALKPIVGWAIAESVK